ncbi:tetratricopeptide repeat protein [Notoacmeibacter sp. MSK16QG-6]|uniref:tetratricopeptide repeat protein n=1 Tax=Notoacmeibacter sp. MSK16QG-6 TaxID=2957982 RepID=UPI00209CB5D0|nr:tetratricopeptide repeat protein [Notoacmeibacter sp. MSK16QG-6]MCP1198254.1 tetratricopeptide repeat protein [Notoacmeibacter sp. MSK16QG-6]
MTPRKLLGRKAVPLALAALVGIGWPVIDRTPVHAATESVDERPVEIRSRAGAFLAAQLATEEGDLDRSITYLRRALSFDPTETKLRVNLMMTLLGRGKFNEALEEAERLKAVPEAERFARLTLSVDAMRGKNFKRVASMLEDRPGQDDLQRLTNGVMAAWAKAGNGDVKGAMADLKALDSQPWYAPFTALQSAFMADLYNLPEADGLYRSLLDDEEASAGAPDLWVQGVAAYASWLIRDGRADFARSVLSSGEAVAPQFIEFGELRDKLKSGKRPERFVKSAREGAAIYLYDLGLVLNRPGSEALTRIYLQMARALTPQNGTILVQIGLAEERLGFPLRALEYYKDVPEKSPLRRVADLQSGLALADAEDYDAAEKSLRDAIKRDPLEERAYLALGDIFARNEQFSEAAELYEEAVEALETGGSKPDWNFYYRRGMAYERLKQWEKAEPDFRRALSLEPNRPEVLNYLGYSLVDRNEKLDEGLDLIRKAVDARPDAGFIVDSLGWAFYRLGRYDEAVRELERAIALMPEDPTVNDHLGDAYWQVGRKLEAEYQWNAALAAVKAMKKPDAKLMAAIMSKQARGIPEDEPARNADAASAVDPAPSAAN